MRGTLLDGRYRVGAPLGAGAQATVYAAVDQTTGANVALKVLAPELAPQGSLAERFRREAAACLALRHPNVIRLFGSGRTGDGSLYFAMELLEHPNLRELVEGAGRLAELRVATLLEQLLDALVHVHARGLVHRDLKPENLLVGPGDHLTVVDFGLVVDEGRTQLTRTGVIVGTPLYLAPETLTGTRADARCDLYAVGVIAYELLAGRRPFQHEDLERALVLILEGRYEPLAAAAPGAHPRWAAFVGRCLAQAPSGRWSSAGEALAELRELRRDLAGDRHPAVSTPIVAEPVRPPRRTWAAPAAAALLLAAVVALASRGPAAGGFDVLDLVARPEPGALAVSWRSGQPYPSLLRVEGRPLEGAGGEPTTSHEVVVAPLPEGAQCTFRIVFPNGDTSLPKTAVAGRLTVTEPSLREVGGQAVVSWRCPVGEAAGLEVVPATGGGRASETVAATRAADGRWQAALPVSTRQASALVVRATLAGGREVRASLADAVRAEVASGGRRLAALDPVELALELDRRVSAAMPRTLTDAGEERLRDVRRTVQGAQFPALLAERGLLQEWRALCPLSGLVLGTRLWPLEGRARYYGLLARGLELALYSHARKHEPRLPLPERPDMGAFALRLGDGPSPAVSVSVFDAGPAGLALAPRQVLADPTRREGVSCRFAVAGAGRFGRAELRLQVAPFRIFVLRLRLNGRVDFLVYDAPVFVHGEVAPVTLRQEVPVDALVEGENALEVRAEPLFDDATKLETRLFRILLALDAGP